VIVLLQIFTWFWKWNNFENLLKFGKVKAYKNCANFWATLYMVYAAAWRRTRYVITVHVNVLLRRLFHLWPTDPSLTTVFVYAWYVSSGNQYAGYYTRCLMHGIRCHGTRYNGKIYRMFSDRLVSEMRAKRPVIALCHYTTAKIARNYYAPQKLISVFVW